MFELVHKRARCDGVFSLVEGQVVPAMSGHEAWFLVEFTDDHVSVMHDGDHRYIRAHYLASRRQWLFDMNFGHELSQSDRKMLRTVVSDWVSEVTLSPVG